jgi:hypothetical protein
MSDASKPSPSSNASSTLPATVKEALQKALKERGVLDGITVLSGNESNLTNDDKTLLEQFNSIARKMGIHPLPTLLLFETETHPGCIHCTPDQAEAWSTITHDGTGVVAVSRSLRKTMEANTQEDGTPFATTPLERLVAQIAHEEGHIKNKDNTHPTRKEAIRQELDADKEGARATCNPQAMEDSLESVYVALLPNGVTLQQLNIYQEKTVLSSNDPHPLLPTRIAQLEYMKAYPTRGCKAK